jgi:ubiquinone/menaquinone biosynthesis C-methylase UbiE
MIEQARFRAQETYNAAADNFDARPLSFWQRYGERTVERLSLVPGATVLDVACGTGASAIPAAERVGPGGHVFAVDLAENMLAIGRSKAAIHNLQNIEFKLGDMMNLGMPDDSFDAVICVFGIFFVSDMAAAVRELWRMVRPGGKLAITTWGERCFEPLESVWNEAVRAERPDLYTVNVPWDRITKPESVGELLKDGGVLESDITPESGNQPLGSPEDWWTIVLGSGLRWTVDQLTPEQSGRIREVTIGWARRNDVSSIETNVIYAVATKPPRPPAYE